jgi:hypothetical protein
LEDAPWTPQTPPTEALRAGGIKRRCW